MASAATDTRLVVAIIGPTGTGKSAVAVALAAEFGGTVISADSMQVYQRMNIGTAKLDAYQRCGISHELIDVVPPQYHFSVAEYQRLATSAIETALATRHLPIVAGGTGLYVRALLDGYEFVAEKPDDGTRRRLRSLSEEELRRCLALVDPLAERAIAPGDSRRLSRALEIAEETQSPPSEVKHRRHAVPWRVLRIGLSMDRSQLYARLEQRVDAMMAAGMEEEVRSLLASGVTSEDTAMQGIGYKEIASWLQGTTSREEAIALWKQRTRNYAKRQETWFRKEKDVHWIDVSHMTEPDVVRQAAGLISAAREEQVAC
ncbi:MAG TPA: tRNA (adenosine(37)-N6)-dimethylallyltransferase MiaA [Candidatus Cryosericum sp.]|nr:tRNA (adenosine(37)-N6)-dimethylallyltransferase MiaA [Candidatus Cryosericum sp.]